MKSKRNLFICLFILYIATCAGSLEFWGRVGSEIVVDDPTRQPLITLLEVEVGGASATNANYQQELGFGAEEKIVFSFGFRPDDALKVLPALDEVQAHYPLKYVIIANPGSDIGELRRGVEKYGFVDFRVRALPLDELYTYLYAADVLLIHRESSTKYRAVLSSTVCQVLGSGCPILFHESNYVEKHGEEIVKYRDLDDMKRRLVDLFEGRFDVDKVEGFLREHDAEAIGRRYLRLFEALVASRRGSRG